jgi:hypothetical protein
MSADIGLEVQQAPPVAAAVPRMHAHQAPVLVEYLQVARAQAAPGDVTSSSQLS